jgi:aminoglycoside phosphotransferase (APT) family kinase protein
MSATVFPLVGPGHPFERGLEAFRDRLASDPRLSGAPGAREVKAVRGADGAWSIDRLYCFVPGPAARGFGGALLHQRVGAPEVHEFPRDPRLKALSAPGSPLLRDATVLRYVPLRRLTFRATTPDGRVRIGKFKRLSTLETSYRRLVAAWRAGRAGATAFAVPRPAGVDTARSVFFQEAASGVDASTLVDAATLEAIMTTVGRVHHDLHGLEVAEAPHEDLGALPHELEHDLDWIAFMVGRAGARVARVGERILRRIPDPAGAPRAFCHGDFVTSQLLLDGERVTVTDYDVAAIGDPCREVAMLMASLPFDVPYLATAGDGERKRARDAYLAAYEERAGAAVDPARLAWHRACAAVYHLAMRIRKGRADRPEVDRSLDQLEALAGGLR